MSVEQYRIAIHRDDGVEYYRCDVTVFLDGERRTMPCFDPDPKYGKLMNKCVAQLYVEHFREYGIKEPLTIDRAASDPDTTRPR